VGKLCPVHFGKMIFDANRVSPLLPPLREYV
jgi:hypothetical protein